MIEKEDCNHLMTLIASNSEVLQTYKRASSPKITHMRKNAIQREHVYLLDYKTRKLVERKTSMNIFPSKYVFKIKATGKKFAWLRTVLNRCTGWSIWRHVTLSSTLSHVECSSQFSSKHIFNSNKWMVSQFLCTVSLMKIYV